MQFVSRNEETMDEQLSYVDLRGVGPEERVIGAGELSNG